MTLLNTTPSESTRVGSGLIACTALVALIAFSGLAASNAVAQSVDSYLAAGQKFDDLTKQSLTSGEMPRAVSLEVARVIAELSDTKGYLRAKTYGSDELGELMKICGKSNSVVMSYVLFEAKNGIDPKADRERRVMHVVKAMEKNVARFQGELESLQPFLVRCVGTQIPLLTTYVEGLKPEAFTNTRRAGLEKARQGIWQTYSGFLDMASDTQYQESYRGAVMNSLAEMAEQYASVLPPVNRSALLTRIDEIAVDADKPTQTGLEKIKAAFGSEKCVGLCKL